MGRKNRAYPDRPERCDRDQCRHRRPNPVSARINPDLCGMRTVFTGRIHDGVALWLYQGVKGLPLDDDDANDPSRLRHACLG